MSSDRYTLNPVVHGPRHVGYIVYDTYLSVGLESKVMHEWFIKAYATAYDLIELRECAFVCMIRKNYAYQNQRGME